MKTVRDYHEAAMEQVDLAWLAGRHHRNQDAAEHRQEALRLEMAALDALAQDGRVEPSYSVFARSAASLALQCGDLRLAEKLACDGLAGEPPSPIDDELREILEDAQFWRHLRLRGLRLADDELQMVVSGPAVSHGMAEGGQVIQRIGDTNRLLTRTRERLDGRPYRESGRPSGADVIWLSAPRAASFALTIKLATAVEQLALPTTDPNAAVIDEVTKLLTFASEGDVHAIRLAIPDEAYRRNFVELVRRIAPDGRGLHQVGFTAYKDGVERSVSLLPATRAGMTGAGADDDDGTSETVCVRGRLRFANDLALENGRIKIEDESGQTHEVVVPKGMMSDIVRPLWDSTVMVTGRRQGRTIHMDRCDPCSDAIE